MRDSVASICCWTWLCSDAFLFSASVRRWAAASVSATPLPRRCRAWSISFWAAGSGLGDGVGLGFVLGDGEGLGPADADGDGVGVGDDDAVGVGEGDGEEDGSTAEPESGIAASRSAPATPATSALIKSGAF